MKVSPFWAISLSHNEPTKLAWLLKNSPNLVTLEMSMLTKKSLVWLTPRSVLASSVHRQTLPESSKRGQSCDKFHENKFRHNLRSYRRIATSFGPGYAAKSVNHAEKSFMKLIPGVNVIKLFFLHHWRQGRISKSVCNKQSLSSLV